MEESGNNRKRPRREDATSGSSIRDDGKEEEANLPGLIRHHHLVGPTLPTARVDPPLGLGQPTASSVTATNSAQQRALESLATAASSNPLAGGNLLASTNTDSSSSIQRALFGLRGLQPQFPLQLPVISSDANQQSLSVLQYLLAQGQQQQQQQFNLHQPFQQPRQSSNTAQLLQALQQHQQQQQQQQQQLDILLQLQQQMQQPSPAADLSRLHQNSSTGGLSVPMLQFLQQSQAMSQQASQPQPLSLQEQIAAAAAIRRLLQQPPSRVVAPPPQGGPLSALALQLGASANPTAPLFPDRLTSTLILSAAADQAARARGAAITPSAEVAAAAASPPTAAAAAAPVAEPQLSGRAAVTMSRPTDENSLSSYQCLARHHIEIFEAHAIDVERGAQGRNKPIVLGQVGLRCIHCKHLPLKQRARASTYYPARLNGVYQVRHV